MKKLIHFSFSLSLITWSTFANYSERIFHCHNFGTNESVDELYIVESKKGRVISYEVEVPYQLSGESLKFTKKLNFIPKYEGRVLQFTTGNYRVIIDTVFPVEKKYKTFVRLPFFDVHSTDWFCKDL